MLRRLLIAVLLLLLAAVVAADRVGAHVAAHVLAGKLQTDEHLPQRPTVSIGGIPFLTQAFGGDYRDVDVTAHDFRTPDGVTVTTLKAHLHNAHIPFSKVVHGSVSKVPVDHVDGTAFVSFNGITRYLAGQGTPVTLKKSGPGSVDVIRKISAGKRTGLVEGTATVSVSHAVVTLSVGHLTVSGLSGKGHPHVVPVTPYVLSLPLRSLPFRIDVTSVTVGAGGITAAGTANHVTLGS